jgi:hypothetical protein
MKETMFRTTLLLTAMLLLAGTAFSQEAEEEFKPNGKPIVLIFTNYHSTFSDGAASKKFEIQRAYLGYQYQLSEKISGKLVLDVGDPNFGNLQMTAYLKNAYVQYDNGKLLAKIGMIGLNQYNLQEKLWGGRYLYKSFMDEHSFGPSADLGAFVAYQIHKTVSVDFTVANGDGYKSIEKDSVFKFSGGITVTPAGGLDLRVSYDHMGQDSAQQTLALYAGYRHNNYTIGAEYNKQLNYKMLDNRDRTGLSFYGSYMVKRTRIFGRYDRLSSVNIGSDTDPWNYQKDGQIFIAGVEFNPIKNLSITPNYQGWIRADGGPMSNSAYLSLQIKF